MAGFAFSQSMLPGEWEIGHRVMIEIDVLPTAFRMAALAVLPASAFVRVVGHVTAETGCRWFHKLSGLLVTRLAGCPAMSAFEREIGQPVVVEADQFPRARSVTGFALGPVLALVGIVLRMTGKAAARGMLVRIELAVTSSA